MWKYNIKFLLFIILVYTQNAYGVELIAHRANSGGFKENTLEAISNSWECKADAVEIDVRISKDRIVYLFHDETINGINVALYTHSEMHNFDHTIAKLSSVLNLDIPSGYYILDLKDESLDFLEALITLIQESNFPVQKISFQSFNINVLSKIRSSLPGAQYIYLSKLKRKLPWLGKPSSSELLELLANDNISTVSIKGRQFIDTTFIEDLKLKGIKVLVWNINNLERVKYYINLGVDGIITDRLSEIR